jgi:DNA-binding NarL/FixJ family response regulator
MEEAANSQDRHVEGAPKVVIADDEAIHRYTLERTLDRQFRVVAAVSDGLTAVQAVEEHEPDIALLDISMPVLNGLEAAQRIVEKKPAVKVIIVTSHADPTYVQEAFRRGAKGYVLKGRINELLEAIRTVMQGEFYRPSFGG